MPDDAQNIKLIEILISQLNRPEGQIRLNLAIDISKYCEYLLSIKPVAPGVAEIAKRGTAAVIAAGKKETDADFKIQMENCAKQMEALVEKATPK